MSQHLKSLLHGISRGDVQIVERALENPRGWNIEVDPGISIAIHVAEAGQSN